MVPVSLQAPLTIHWSSNPPAEFDDRNAVTPFVTFDMTGHTKEGDFQNFDVSVTVTDASPVPVTKTATVLVSIAVIHQSDPGNGKK